MRVGVDAPAGAFGVPSAPDLSGPARLFGALYQAEREKADQIAILSAETELDDLQRTLLLDREKGVLNARGLTALDAAESADERFEQALGEARGKLNERQRQRFEQSAARAQSGFRLTVERHVSQEMRRHDDQTTEAALDARVDSALRNFSDREQISEDIDRGLTVLREYAARNGIAKEVVGEQAARFVSKVQTGVIQRLVDTQQVGKAREYYQSVTEDIRGEDRSAIEKQLETGTRLATAQAVRDEILADDPTVSMSKARELIKERNLDAETRREAEREVEHAITVRERDANEAERARYEEAAKFAEQGRRPPVSLWEPLTSQQKSSIDARIRQLAAGESVETDWHAYYTLTRFASTPAMRETFLKTDLLALRHKIAEPEWKELVRMQNALREGRTDDPVIQGHQTTLGIVNSMVTASGLFEDTSPKPGSNEAKRLDEFNRVVNERVRAWKLASGKEQVPPEEVRRIVGETITQTIRVKDAGWMYFDADRVRATLLQDEKRRAYVPMDEIPPVETTQLRNLIESAGGTASTDRVQRLYAAMVLGDRALFDTILAERGR